VAIAKHFITVEPEDPVDEWHIAGVVVHADPARLLGGGSLSIGGFGSRAWDPLGLSIMVALAVGVCVLLERFEHVEQGLCNFLVICSLLGVLVGTAGFLVWCSGYEQAPWMPVVLLVLATLTGLIAGIVGVVENETRQVLTAALLGPSVFCLGASLCGGFGEGFLHAAVVGLGLGLAGSALSGLLCLITLAILKSGFWRDLVRWLSPSSIKTAPEAAPEPQSVASQLEALDGRIAALVRERETLAAHPDAQRI